MSSKTALPWTLWNTDKHLDAPLRWRKPRIVGVTNPVGDLFHESVPDDFIVATFGAMFVAPQHTYQILTKRPARMRTLLDGADKWREAPHANIWLGVSVEDQPTADERIPLLLQTPAAVRIVSVEPLLNEVLLCDYLANGTDCPIHGPGVTVDENPGLCNGCGEYAMRRGIDWVIVGGESGPQARPCNIEWIRSIVAQCKNAEVACFVKQLGSFAFQMPKIVNVRETPGMRISPLALRDRKGADPAEWLDDLRIREFPT